MSNTDSDAITFDAVIFDLDGVITDTASVHSVAWKQMFDEFLEARAEQRGEPFREFTHADDYLPYVDGKPRYKGVASFLDSRGIDLPYGNPDDPPGWDTVCGLGNRKNQLFNEIIAQGNVKVFSTTVDLVRALRENEIGVGVASSSKNARTVLAATGLLELFETCVDGVVSAELSLKGKPEPDIFTTACDNLGAHYDRAVVVEDAVSGVQAAARGNFGLVLGIAREDNERELKLNGADIVVKDLGEMSLERLQDWFSNQLGKAQWSLEYDDYVKEAEGHREALCTVGNGYFGTRGALEESRANGASYPGTYIARVYNRLESQIGGRTIVNEDLVNCPNWLPVTFRIGDGEWWAPDGTEIASLIRRLNLQDGLFSRKMVVRDAAGRETLIESLRVASMAQPHLAALQYRVTPLNYSGRISIRSGLDGTVINSGVERYRQLSSKHLEPVDQGGGGEDIWLVVRTNQSGIQIAEAARHRVSVNDEPLHPSATLEKVQGASYTVFELEANRGCTVCVDKVVAIYTSLDEDSGDPLEAAREALQGALGFDQVRQASAGAWANIWREIEIEIEGDRAAQKLLRLNQYHLMVSASPHNASIDAGIAARGLHGEAYRGHIFWDELYIVPFYCMHFPETARSVLLYRYRRLDQARAYAKEHGYRGAMFPWQSGSDGREETQVLHLNPKSGKWGPDHSSLQRHVSLAIAYNVWQYYWISGDTGFMADYGTELFLEICRFWASAAHYDEALGRFVIPGVMGPDEYHEKYPGSETGGLRDNSYTNIMVVWAFQRAFDILDLLGDGDRREILIKLSLADDELDRWRQIITGIHIPLSNEGILEQFDGYFGLKELDWDAYRSRYGNIGRMDRILKAEGKSPDKFKVAKQADTLMAFYNLHQREIARILLRAGYSPGDDLLRANLDYYLGRTSHGSTLSRLVHSYLANLVGNQELSWRLYKEALESDYVDIQGGTTKEGIHTGVMGGTAFLALKSYAGLNLDGDLPSVEPCLPAAWRSLRFNIGFRGDRIRCIVTPDSVAAKVESTRQETIELLVYGRKVSLAPDRWETATLAGEEC